MSSESSNPLVQFYHLTSTRLEVALPALVAKAYGADYRVVLVSGSDEQAEYFNQLLWTFDPASFLPHGTEKDGDPSAQPILISAGFSAANQATLAMVVDGSIVPESESFQRVIDLFDGRDEQSVAAARERWTHYRNRGCERVYRQQTPSGGWQEKATG